MTKFNTGKLPTTSLAERLARGRSHSITVNEVGRIQGTVVVGGLAVAANISPVGIGHGLDSGGTGRFCVKRFANNTTELTRELLSQNEVCRRTSRSDTAGHVIHEFGVAADTLRVAFALGRELFGTVLLHRRSDVRS